MRSPSGGRHELGQNFLYDRGAIGRILHLVDHTSGPILEIGCGHGALTRPLAARGRSLLAIDIDPACVLATRRSAPAARVMYLDALRVRLDRPVVVGNLPFHLTTPILRRLLSAPRWTDAVLLLQWEVARKRAGVGGRTMLTAQTDPWFTVRLDRRVPAEAFRPRPSIDGGILTISRRDVPLLPAERRRDYERFVKAVFTARGRGIAAMLRSAGAPRPDRSLRELGIAARALPRDLGPEEWAGLFERLR
ncbi:23S ribosomal RNA methyltransferase Erm [Aeromicrobium piscarium]|uniref:23S ribosomal RNA methyltransferase Erm n=1 Tax=Aeromicrobium piscarium TaxID=2590901 RepID=A0A554RWE6_9ACTN|nr:23S ribosomal RNA methyltransferase Erm [Aeromicrobium piscarium]TSD58395.1 23S ribosomal RNA methyltransferase Erm [Aeromicrobium piscarium]